MRIGVLTGGGDCPGLNAVIRAVVRKGVGVQGHEFVGYRDGWRGPLENDHRPLGVPEVRGILPRGGTILGSSRTNPFAVDGGPEKLAANLEAAGVDALIAIGGEDTLGAASRLHSEHGLNVVGVPKTIDNDLSATDYTFGFDTAVNVAMEAIDRLHTTADSHHRVLIAEVMGRHAGWIALHAGLAGGANTILIPEREFDIDAVCELVGRRFASHFAPIIVVAEGANPIGGMPQPDDAQTDSFGHARLGGIGHWLEAEIERRTGKETRRRSSATSSGAGPRRRSTGSSRRASGCMRSTRWTQGRVGEDDGAAGDGHRIGRAERGDRGAEDGARVSLCGVGSFLWLSFGGAPRGRREGDLPEQQRGGSSRSPSRRPVRGRGSGRGDAPRDRGLRRGRFAGGGGERLRGGVALQGAKGELAAHGASAGHFKIAARCLAPSERAGAGWTSLPTAPIRGERLPTPAP